MNYLSSYAIAHLRMADIGHRFEAVIARQPAKIQEAMRWRVGMARDSARAQFRQFPHELSAFDVYVHRKI